MISPTEGNNDRKFFTVAAGLKRILGRELITDAAVAIFELVKNAHDANANNAYLLFTEAAIVVADDGTGMTMAQLEGNWLNVAYSDKRRGYNGRPLAGSKGIGRFCADRLGTELRLQTRSSNPEAISVLNLHVNWTDFDDEKAAQFQQVPIIFSELSDFNLPKQLPKLSHGTAITISGLTAEWKRETLLRLKSRLAKLIDPFGDVGSGFRIHIFAPDEVERDKTLSIGDPLQSELVNGEVQNFIFNTLKEKTTHLAVEIDAGGTTLTTTLTDRGELIYKTSESNEFALLRAAQFKCELYFLNRAAKLTFKRRMGIDSVGFGSVFLFRNGFRVFPIGEQGDDWFGIDRRKQQGFARYLGTRDLIGKIEVRGGVDEFQEASSRDQGLIDTAAVQELKRAFWEKCLRRLERYVVTVTFPDKMDKDRETTEGLNTDKGRARIVAAVAGLLGNDDMVLVSHSKHLIEVLNERAEEFEATLADLNTIAKNAHDQELEARIVRAALRFTQLERSRAEALRIANEERTLKEAAQTRAAAAEAEALSSKEQLTEVQNRNLFLASAVSLDLDTVLDMHHLITIYAADLQQQLINLVSDLRINTAVENSLLVSEIEPMAFLVKKILAVSKFATRANFRVRSEYINADLSAYINEYVQNIATNFVRGITINVVSDHQPFVKSFKPIDVSILVDNLVSNAKKAHADTITFSIDHAQPEVLEITVTDNGAGISPKMLNSDVLFELGSTTTGGSGMGLYHVRQVVLAMNGSITAISGTSQGAQFMIRIVQ